MKIPNVTIQQLLEAGVHLGHKTLRWNPKMKKYIFSFLDSILKFYDPDERQLLIIVVLLYLVFSYLFPVKPPQ